MTKSRKIGIAFALLLTFALVFANIIPFTSLGNANIANAVSVVPHPEWKNEYTGSYYNNLNVSLTGTAFRTQLASLITSTHHTNTVYNGSSSLALNNVWPHSDKDMDNINANTMKWFYSGTVVSANSFGGSVGQTNREHVWAKNGGNTFTAESGPGADAHHLRPTESQLNSTRGNLGFGEVAQTTGNIAKQNNSTSYGSFPDGLCFRAGSFFYPAKGYRGATARILMYMQVRYGDQFNLYFVDGASTSNGKGIGKISDLFKWHLQEPPTEEEIYRNHAIAEIQGNRNPFIDHPEYAEMIYCNDGQSYNNTLTNLVAQYGGYLGNTNPPTPPTLTGLTLSQTALNLTEGQVSQQITVQAVPSNASNSVTWGSSNTRVATVSNGVITAVGVGTATITATSTVNTSIQATLSVTVSAKKIEVESISISPNSLTLTQGGTSQLTVTVSPSGANNSVSWSSSDTHIATVSQSGLVTAVGAGTATITATSTENSNVKSSIKVTVNESKIELQSLTITPNSLTLKSRETGSLTVKASPSGANNSVSWSSSDTHIATVSQSGVVTAVGVGTATITATSTENANIKTTMLVTVVSDEIKVESISISPDSLHLILGSILHAGEALTVTASPAGASNLVTWSSSNEDIAKIEPSGILYAVGEGTATITATSVDNPSVSASITVTVVREQSSSEVIAEFNKCMDEYNSATTLEGRYNALKQAIQAFNKLCPEDKMPNSDYYETLKTAVVKYNNDATAVNDAFTTEMSFVAQISAVSFSMAFLALAVVIVKKFI